MLRNLELGRGGAKDGDLLSVTDCLLLRSSMSLRPEMGLSSLDLLDVGAT